VWYQDDGGFYYYNNVTGETTRDLPEGYRGPNPWDDDEVIEGSPLRLKGQEATRPADPTPENDHNGKRPRVPKWSIAKLVDDMNKQEPAPTPGNDLGGERDPDSSLDEWANKYLVEIAENRYLLQKLMERAEEIHSSENEDMMFNEWFKILGEEDRDPMFSFIFRRTSENFKKKLKQDKSDLQELSAKDRAFLVRWIDMKYLS